MSQYLIFSDARWDDLCCNVPIAMHEMLKTWQYESHSPAETVQKLVNHIKYEVPAWAICVCAWCCGYIHELRMEQRAFLTSERSENTDRPSQPGLLQFLLSPINDRGMDPVFNDRCSMMVHVMQCMSANIDRKDDAPGSSLPVEINQTPSKVMQQLFNNCIKQKHFSTKILHKFKQLLILGGAEWFCSTIVK
ncbi:mediator of RNA polymerase II transcription subunit 24, partial [Exaiptasia diaphana]|uniref:Mediator of RNA polymerase II transcription subunit 24 n=1 Tax=Exaiptasia diaphana TaxID=2652724 RepID=A0A913YKS9_EXADI